MGRNLVAEQRVQSCQRTFFLAWRCLVQRRHWWERKRLRQKSKKGLKQILALWRMEGLVHLSRRRHLEWRIQSTVILRTSVVPPVLKELPVGGGDWDWVWVESSRDPKTRQHDARTTTDGAAGGHGDTAAAGHDDAAAAGYDDPAAARHDDAAAAGHDDAAGGHHPPLVQNGSKGNSKAMCAVA